MRITLTGRRLALAAVLVLGGVAAPLAYGTITNGKSAGLSAAPAVPLAPASPSLAQGPASSGDNPYQFVHKMTSSDYTCTNVSLPAGQDFVLESVSVFTPGGRPVPAKVWIGMTYKESATTLLGTGCDGPEISLDGFGNGTRTFNFLVRPDTFTNAAVGDLYDLYAGFETSNTSGNTVLVVFTGQRVVTTPTASMVLDFRARSGSRGTTLRWTTGSEAEIAGFNVWRYRNSKGVKVNRSLLRAKRRGNPVGASYSFVDRAPGARRGLTYRLQLVDQRGRRTWYAAFAIASK